MLPDTLSNLCVPLLVSAVRLEAAAACKDGTLGHDVKIGFATAPELHAAERWTSVVRPNRGNPFKMQTRARNRIPENAPEKPSVHRLRSAANPTLPDTNGQGHDRSQNNKARYIGQTNCQPPQQTVCLPCCPLWAPVMTAGHNESE